MFRLALPCLLWLTLLVPARVSFSQNIVVNGGFEDVNICTEFKAPCSPSGWFFIRKDAAGFNSPGAMEGSHYLTVMTAHSSDGGRRYWETMLLCPLVPGEKYMIRLQAAANGIGPNLHDIGLWFTDSLIYTLRDTLLQPAVYFSFMGSKVKELHHGFQLEKEFIATQAHQYLIVGNFSSEPNQQIYSKRSVKDYEMRMYIDNLEIIQEKRSLCAGAQRIKDSLYAIHDRHTINGKKLILDSLPLLFATADSDTVKRALADTVTVRQIDTVTINNIQFEFNSYRLKDAAVLDSMKAVFMRKDISGIRVAGFTDDIGSDTYNLSLSAKRAEEIRRLIMERFGIASSVISAEGKGISTSYTDKSRNRRVEVYIYH